MMIQQQLLLHPIGTIHTPFHSKYSAPRQPASASEKTVGIITLSEHMNFEQALDDIQGFEYIWVLFWFHKNTNWKPKVLPPNGGRKKRGLFSTRSPHRPNPIGLSLCKLIDVRGRKIRIENPDMLDGTPILDLKPYLPHAEAIPFAQAGWMTQATEASESTYTVTLAPQVKKMIAGLEESKGGELQSYIVKVLSRDPFPHTYRRIKVLSDGLFMIAAQRWRFEYTIKGSSVKVNKGFYAKERGEETA